MESEASSSGKAEEAAESTAKEEEGSTSNSGKEGANPMEEGEFQESQRVGRRNAVADINSDGSAATATLPQELQKLSCSGEY